MENKQKVNVSDSEKENDDEERKHFCKVISAFRLYRLVQLPLNDFWLFARSGPLVVRVGGCGGIVC